jgi:hypothetical protein
MLAYAVQQVVPDVVQQVTAGEAINTVINLLSVALLLAVLEYLRRINKQ